MFPLVPCPTLPSFLPPPRQPSYLSRYHPLIKRLFTPMPENTNTSKVTPLRNADPIASSDPSASVVATNGDVSPVEPCLGRWNGSHPVLRRSNSRMISNTGIKTVKSSYHLRSESVSESRKAPLPIDFLIVGAGLSGLACAYALGRTGHRVHVLDKVDGLHQHSGGIRVPPNLSKILLEWGFQDELSKAQKCRSSAFLSLETSELIGYLEWQEDVMQETGGDFFLMQYDDLHSMLYKAALSAGATISFNSRIASVSLDEERQMPFVTLADNSVLAADMIIGADGYQSIVKPFVTSQLQNSLDTGHTVVTITVEADKLASDPDWSKWVNAPEWPIWMGDDRNVLAYPTISQESGNIFCVHAVWPDTDINIKDDRESWEVVVPTSALNFQGCHPSIKRIFEMVPNALRTKYIQREIIDDWVDGSGRVVLVGEAAHSLMPCTIHNSALAIEDAAVLGTLMSRLRTREQIPQLLDAFQDLRHNRCRQVHQSELGNAALVMLPPGDRREMRDAGMRLSLTETKIKWSDEQLRDQWDQIGEVFGYNAREAAEDWWIKWGALSEMRASQDPVDLVFQVTRVAITRT